jgi:2-dehydropantoate 2-reductase
VLLAVGTKFRRMRSSMLQAIERGRKPAVDYLNGEVVHRADALGMAAAINRRVQQLIHALGRGETRPSLDLLRRLYDDSRAEAARV